jgi:hypothetical protein
VIAAEPADVALDAALLVRAGDARHAKERIEAHRRAEQHPALAFGSSPAQQHPRHRRARLS